MAYKRTAIVTGSSRGIGEAIARRLAAENYAVTINDVAANEPGITKLVAELNAKHGAGTAAGVVADVTKRSEVKRLVDESVKQLGPLTVMVANAGVAHISSALDATDDEVAHTVAVNFTGVWNCYTEAAKQMIAQGPVPAESTGYKILGASSIVAYKPFPMLSHYSATKGAVRTMTQVFAMELASHKISVNHYAPGIVGTAMWDKIDSALGKIEGRATGESMRKYVTDLTAMGRASVPDDVAKVVGGFLCGPDSDFVTGQGIVVDGGIIFT